MPEYIIIDGAPVEVPAEVVSADGDARAAVANWHKETLKERGVPHILFGDAAVEVPADIAADKTKVIAWADDVAKARGLKTEQGDQPDDIAFDRDVAKQAVDAVAAATAPKVKDDEPATAPAAPAEAVPAGITDITSAKRPTIPVDAVAEAKGE